MEEHIPEAITGAYPLSVGELASAIRRQKEKEEEQKRILQEKEKLHKGSGAHGGRVDAVKDGNSHVAAGIPKCG